MTNCISHIGSLPFTDIAKTIRFNKEFDIAVLSTLPKKFPEEMMLNQLCLGIDGLEVKNNKYICDSQIKAKNNPNWFQVEDEFIAMFEGGHVKWQMLGPQTFLALCADTLSSAQQEEILKIYLEQLIHFHQKLRAHFKQVDFFLDEPMLFSQTDFDWIKKFIKRFHDSSTQVGIHCCQLLSPEVLKNIDFDRLSYDCLLNPDYKGPDGAGLWAGVIDACGAKITSTDVLYRSSAVLTPTCGLALTDELRAWEVVKMLRELADCH